jgi:iron complex outermembrane receptor protein
MISNAISTFRLKPIAAACSVVTMLAAAAAHAQTAAPEGAQAGEQINQVMVVGIRKGIEDAISVKKNSGSIVEAISAEDIGKLPDSSIAESIARLPGLTAQRVNGRAQEISVRGMSGDFAATLLNGREQVSTGDNRSAQFDQYPSELLSGVVVYKTPDATLVGQGLAGTVDLQTVRPLSFAKRTMAVNVRGQKDGVGSEGGGKGVRASAFYIDQFADRTIGVALGYARFTSKGDSVIRTGDYSDITIGGQTVSAPTHFKVFTNHREETRDGLMGVLQWKPTRDFSSMLDLYYSKFNSPTIRKGYETVANATWSGGCVPACTLINPVIKDGKVDSGTWTNTHAVIANDIDLNSAELKAVGWNNRLRLNSDWSVEGDLSYSAAKRKESPFETWAGAPKTMGDSVSFSNGAAGLPNLQWNPSLNYTDPKIITLMDAGGWGMAGYLKNLEVEDKLKSARVGAERTLPDGWAFSKLSVGANYSDRFKSRSVPEYQLQLKAGDNAVINSTSSVMAGDSGIPMISYNELSLSDRYNQVSNTYFDIYLKAWEVTEKNLTSYAKLDIDTTVASIPLRGNVGVQVVRIDQSSTGNAVNTSSGTSDNDRVVTQMTDGASYTDVLPSLNLAAELSHQQTVRLGLAKVMARPRMDQMSNSGTYYVDGLDLNGPTWKGSGGNPKLQPFRAKAVDLSYEKYFGTKAYVAAAAFYKKLDTYIYTYTNGNYDFTGHRNESTFTPASNIGQFTQPQNGTGGTIHGIELSASLPFDLATRFLDGFGATASYARTGSAIKPFGDSDTSPLPGLSRQTSNLTLYYEKHGFSARVSQRARSDFLGEIIGYASTRRFQYIKAERVVDFQLGYEFQTGYLKGASLLLQVNNANDAKYQEYQDRPDNITSTTKYGSTVLFGLNYKL